MIINDVVGPIKDQLERLGNDFVRKDVYLAEHTAYLRDYNDFKDSVKNKTNQLIVTFGGIIGALVGLVTLAHLLGLL